MTPPRAGQNAGIGFKLLLLLGALSAFAPLSFDMYLPGLLRVSRDLHIDGSAAQPLRGGRPASCSAVR